MGYTVLKSGVGETLGRGPRVSYVPYRPTPLQHWAMGAFWTRGIVLQVT